MQTTDKTEEFLKIVELAVQHSGGRLRVAHNERNTNRKKDKEAARFIKLDERRLGRDIDIYIFMGNKAMGWEQTLPTFLMEVILPLKKTLPESYTKSSEALREFGTTVYSGDILQLWQELF